MDNLLLTRIAGWNRLTLVLVALFAGLVSALGFAPYETVAAPIIGVATLLLLLAGGRHPFLSGFAFGVGHFALGLSWIATAFTFQAAMPAAFGYLAVGALALLMALYPAAAALSARRTTSRLVPLTLIFAGFFMLMEIVRGILFTGFPWNPLGAPWLQLEGVAALAAIIGASGLSGLMVLAAGSLAALLAARGEQGRWLLVGVFPLLLFLALVVPRARPPLPAPAGPELLLVQPNMSQTEKHAATGPDDAIDRLMALTVKGLRENPAVHAIIWPEAAIEYPLHEDPTLARDITAPLQSGQLLLTGGIAIERDERGTAIGARNSLYVLDNLGHILSRYDKAHLVPGGEYLPLRSFAEPLGLQRLVPGVLDFWPGPGPKSMNLPGLPAVGPAICYEIIFPGAVVTREPRPGWILTVSNDAWFGPSGPPQHYAQARLRAIEEGLPLVRVTSTGISGLIGPRGENLAVLPAHMAVAETVRLPAPLPATPFAHMGLLAPGLMALLLFAGGSLMARRHDRKT
ncbi:MAG: apolipoprotein N-acyltransferase [Sphingomonadaceae bacterium]